MRRDERNWCFGRCDASETPVAYSTGSKWN